MKLVMRTPGTTPSWLRNGEESDWIFSPFSIGSSHASIRSVSHARSRESSGGDGASLVEAATVSGDAVADDRP